MMALCKSADSMLFRFDPNNVIFIDDHYLAFRTLTGYVAQNDKWIVRLDEDVGNPILIPQVDFSPQKGTVYGFNGHKTFRYFCSFLHCGFHDLSPRFYINFF